MEEVNNELDTDGRKNETVKTESLMEKQPSHNDYYEDASQNKARQWRNVNSGVWLQSIESDDDLDSSDFQNNQVEQEEQPRKVSPKFWYWFWIPVVNITCTTTSVVPTDKIITWPNQYFLVCIIFKKFWLDVLLAYYYCARWKDDNTYHFQRASRLVISCNSVRSCVNTCNKIW